MVSGKGGDGAATTAARDGGGKKEV